MMIFENGIFHGDESTDCDASGEAGQGSGNEADLLRAGKLKGSQTKIAGESWKACTRAAIQLRCAVGH